MMAFGDFLAYIPGKTKASISFPGPLEGRRELALQNHT
jgi:hypothetical protein